MTNLNGLNGLNGFLPDRVVRQIDVFRRLWPVDGLLRRLRQTLLDVQRLALFGRLVTVIVIGG